MSKAHARVELEFLLVMMEKMSFSKRWVDMIMKCISLVEYTININGRMGTSFRASRGLRPKDPLSPFLP